MERLNQWMTLVANIGVVAGLVFLAFEIRVNTNAVRSEATTSYLSHSMELSAQLGSDSEGIAMMEGVNADGWSPGSTRLFYVGNAQFKAVEFAFVQWKEGNLDTDLWNGNNRAVYEFLWTQHWMRELWPGLRSNFSRVFQRHMDQLIADICSRRKCRDLPTWLLKREPEMSAGSEAWSARFDDT